MNPNELLRMIRATIRQMAVDEIDEIRAAHAEELAEHVEALDEWLSKGGFRPAAWCVPVPLSAATARVDAVAEALFASTMTEAGGFDDAEIARVWAACLDAHEREGGKSVAATYRARAERLLIALGEIERPPVEQSDAELFRSDMERDHAND